MDMNELMTAISTVGFPIVCCAAMFYQNWKTQESHKEESQKWAEALANNTLALEKLSIMIDRSEKDD